jgi:LPS-assembly lipoprotein
MESQARLAAVLGLGLLAGCQAQPLYGSMSGANQSITVSEADSRVEQVVRNELVLGFGGEQQNGAYQLNLSAARGSPAFCLAAWTTSFQRLVPL